MMPPNPVSVSQDDALQERVFPGDGPHVGGDAFADLVGELADDGPDGLLGIVRQEREVEADELVIGLGELEGLLARADFSGYAVQLVVEHIAQALGEDQWQDEILVFGRILGTTDGASSVPDPGLDGFILYLMCNGRFSGCFFSGCCFFLALVAITDPLLVPEFFNLRVHILPGQTAAVCSHGIIRPGRLVDSNHMGFH